MNETTKSKAVWGTLEPLILTGNGIDIGCGPDPVTLHARRFDREHGDANVISRYVKETFDYVYSSHCLEHMDDPKATLAEWWKLVKHKGYMFFSVPDEDLYEQGIYPSTFNPDHKATFTISKSKSWSPRSINVLDLALSLPNAEIIKLELQDQGYDRRRMIYGPPIKSDFLRALLKVTNQLRKGCGVSFRTVEDLRARCERIDQTLEPGALAQIVCILKKLGQ